MKKQYNDIGNFFRDKLDNYSKEPPDSVWKNINSNIPKPNFYNSLTNLVQTKVFLISVVASVSVVSIATFSYFKFFADKKIDVSEAKSPDAKASPLEDISKNNTLKPSSVISITENDLKSYNTDLKKIKGKNTDVSENKIKEDITSINEKRLQSNKEKEEIEEKSNIDILNNNEQSEISNKNTIANDKVEISESAKESKLNNENANENDNIFNSDFNGQKRRQYFLNTSIYNKIKCVYFFDDKGNEVLKFVPPLTTQIYLPIDITTLPNGKYEVKIETESQVYYKKLSLSD